ncbi:MAG: MxaP protein [Methylococcales bacterium]|nr:MxaP protein [Methylococcales bacterium]
MKLYWWKMIPESGLRDFAETYLTWAGVGFLATLVGELLDSQAKARYGAYYTAAINDAVGYPFWVLLTSIALLLFCFALPWQWLAERLPGWQRPAAGFRRLGYVFFVVAFDEGALMTGILAANTVHTVEKITLVPNPSFLFTEAGVVTLIGLALVNSLLWFLGEGLDNRRSRSCSGAVAWWLDAPVKIALPLYLMVTGALLLWVMRQ